MRIVTIVGARPQFIKAAAVSRVIRNRSNMEEFIVHTGQHYDENMSKVFFDELKIPKPHVNLEVGSGPQGKQTALMLERIEAQLIDLQPDWLLVYGDTNSTLAGALAAAKLHIPVAHVEAGLRSFNRIMPEEVNRVLTDHASDLLFAPSDVAVNNLSREGLTDGVHVVGDVMFDAVDFYRSQGLFKSDALDGSIGSDNYALATIHRAENTDDPTCLKEIFAALRSIRSSGMRVVLPLHPRTRKYIDEYDISTDSLDLIEPVSYLSMMALVESANRIITDSGGLQKEAFWLQTPCITVRDETEWVETVSTGWNSVVGADSDKIVKAIQSPCPSSPPPNVYGDGHASEKILTAIENTL